MACYLIACELNCPGRDYIDLTDAIERLDERWHQCLEAMWLVVTDKTAVEIRDHLKPYLDRNDQVFVAQLSGDAAWRGGRGLSSGLTALLRPHASPSR